MRSKLRRQISDRRAAEVFSGDVVSNGQRPENRIFDASCAAPMASRRARQPWDSAAREATNRCAECYPSAARK